MPPIFTSENFLPEIAEKILETKLRKGGYDLVEYNLTRFNNVSRPLTIPHPLPYAHLSLCIKENWDNLKIICKNQNSIIKPEYHNDGRVIIMNYEKSRTASHRKLIMSQSKKFVVNTDIANFFLSIYTHAIPWALVGINEAKKNKLKVNEWYNKFDKYQRHCKRDETMGVPIGPATSNIVSETILRKVDESLKEKNYTFIRFIDDYTAFCDTYKEAENFITDLKDELRKYKLVLNIKKTSIKKTPIPTSNDWISDLSTRMPKSKKISYYEAIRFIDYSVEVQEKTPDGSILKFALKSIVNRLDINAKLSVIKYALNLAFHYPILLPLLDKLLIGFHAIKEIKLINYLTDIIKENLRNRRSDVMVWSIYLIIKYCNSEIDKDLAKSIIETEDCLSITMLYLTNNHDDTILEFVNKLKNQDIFLLDEYWFLLYQLFYDGKITNPYENESLFDEIKTGKEKNKNAMQREILCFNILKKESVSFIDKDKLKIPDNKKTFYMLLKFYYEQLRKKISI